MKNKKFFSLFSWLLFVLMFFFSPLKSAGAVEVIQNGNFENGLNYWNIFENVDYDMPPLVEPIPESGDYKLSLHPNPNYFGLVVYQPLNITNVSGKTLTLSMNITNVWNVTMGSTVCAYVAYVTTTNNVVEQKLACFQNSSINEPDKLVTATYNMPSTGVKKIIGLGLSKEDYGEFLVDNISLNISGTPTIGPLPKITGIDKERGPYGTTLTITGVNFGNTQGLTSIVSIGNSQDGITVLSWSSNQVIIKINDPAIDGSVVVVNDFVSSNNDKKFKITSPYYHVSLDNTFKTYIKGSIAKFFLNTIFENGYSTITGINYSLDPETTHSAITNSIVSFKNVPVKIEGGAVLEINTANLNPGIYQIGVLADDGVLQKRESGVFILEVVRIGNIKLYYADSEVTGNSINVNKQYSFNLFYEVLDTSGRTIYPPSFMEKLDISIQSSNENLLTVYKQFWGEQFFANDNGSPTLTFRTPDGYTRTLTVNISVANEPKVTVLGIVPDQIINDPNGSFGQSFVYTANHNTTGTEVGWGIYGIYNVDWSDMNVYWGTNSAVAGGTWIIRGNQDINYEGYVMPIKIGNALVTGACYGAGGSNFVERVKKLYIINTPGTAMVSGQPIPAGGFGEYFYLEFYDLQGNFLFPRLAESMHFTPFKVGFIPPGLYKVKFVFRGNAKDYWYPNSYTFEDAQVINLSGNQDFNLPYVIATEDYPGIPWVNPVRKDFGTRPPGTTTSQEFIFKNLGNSTVMLSGVSIEAGDGSFTASHSCPSSLEPFASCSIIVSFSPTSPGQKLAFLRISGPKPEQGEYLEVPLIGMGQAPVGAGSVFINGDNQFTNNRTVNLTITCDDPVGCSSMCISNDTTTCTTFVTFATTKSWTLSAGDGTKTVYVKLKNKNNQIGDPFSDNIVLDTTAPSGGSFTATAGNNEVQLNWSGYTDVTSGIALYVIYGGTILPASCSGTQLYSGTGNVYIHTGLTNGTTYYYRLCIYDNAGNLTTSTTSARPLPETNPPTLSNFTINNGDNYTKLTTVTLQINANDESGVAQMCVSNTNTCSNWITYSNTLNWTLTTGAGLKTVYIWFKDIWGNTNSTPFIEEITLDNVAPVDSVNPLVVAPGTEQNTIKLEWFPATDANSFVKEYRVMRALTSAGTACTGTPIAVIRMSLASTTILYVDSGLLAGKTYFYRVCAVDAVGNMSAGKTGSGKCNDTLGPTDPFVTINNDDVFTKSPTVTLRFGANDPGGIAQVCIGNTATSFSCSTFVPTNPTKTWRLTTPSGEKTVYVKFKDGAGNESTVASDSIWLDIVKPVDGKLTGMSGNGFVLLSWQDAVENGGSGLDKYIVKLGSGSYPSCTTGTTLYEGLDKSFLHNGLVNGTSYYYRVCAVDKAGNISSGKTYLGKPSTLTTITGSFPIATSTKKEQSLRVAFDGTNYAVAIKGIGTTTNSIGIQFLTKDGVKIGTPLILNGLSGVEPQIAYGFGKYLVVWSDDTTKTIRGQIINASTRTFDGNPFDISQTASSAGCIDTYTNPIFDGNNFFVVWNYDSACTNDGSGHDVFGRFVDADGGMIGGIINLIDETATGRQEYHTMAYDGDYIYVFWQDARRGVSISNPCGGSDLTSVLTDIYGQIVSKSTLATPGAKVGSNFTVYEGSNIVDFEIFGATYNGNYVNVVWQEMTLKCTSGNIDLDKSDIFMNSVFNNATVGSPVNITNATAKKYFAPQVSSAQDGSVLVTWNDLTNMSDIEIIAQRFYGDGTPIGDPFLLVSKAGNQFGGVVDFSNNKFFVLWNDKVTINPTTGEFIFGDVYGAIISFPTIK
ncbi:MAG: IPT/TIG domain-containing protein [Proteobacteria bacterium]|nr:IPT/TIG domain-containing protein [Pseudomonadota bacterium]